MSTFVSFSGAPSKRVANVVVDFLQLAFEKSSPWMSDQIEPGQKWDEVLRKQFYKSKAIILCHTRENYAAKSQWLPFEAGAVWKGGEAPVISLLVDPGIMLDAPLNQFQAVDASHEGLMAIVDILRKKLDSKRPCTTNDEVKIRNAAKKAAKEIRSVVEEHRRNPPVPMEPVIGLRPSERAGEDFDLQNAEKVKLLGLTYRQLSDALASSSFHLSASDIELAIY
jgi:hypothetical protein